MKPIARPVEAIKARYDAVVVGSGYGGGIAASRLARMGLSVCVLERGREFLPGQFPRTLREGYREIQVASPLGQTGARDALFDFRVHGDVSVMVGCGLGGTSLINGNVMLEPEPEVFADACWPTGLRGGPDALMKECYARSRRMLQPVAYSGEPELQKLAAFGTAARALGVDLDAAPITVTFEPEPGGNHAGVEQPVCTLCGDCCSGCNVGAKNTTAMTYLPDAEKHGAEIFCGCRVSHVEQQGGEWRVHLEAAGTMTVVSKFVFLGAGTLGSSEIVLRSRDAGLVVSERAGHRFSGNGDVIAFGYNNDVAVNGVGVGHPPVAQTGPVGPVIAGLIDLRNSGALEGNMVIQEGAIPSLLAPVLPAIMVGVGPVFGTDTDAGDFLDETGRMIESVFSGAYRGAVHNTQTFLVMAHDDAAGVVQIENGRVTVNWPGAGNHPIYKQISKTLEAATAATGGTFTDNPVWHRLLGRNLISVHPLGGCAMGETVDDGAVDHKCRVFGADGSVHAGLYVVDGAAVPRSLGVNPSLTISAIAERAMIHFAGDNGLTFDDDKPGGEGPAIV